MKRNDLILLCILFLIAFGLRFYDLSYPSFRWMDEYAHVPAATHYWSDGQSEPDFWEHPPLRHILLYGFIEFFGDNPYGWRLRNVLFGAMAAVLTFLFACYVSDSRKTGLLAGLLIATDPLHIVMSRYTYEEIYGGVFFLAAIVLYVRHRHRSILFVLSAIFMGCALATKWYYVPCWFLIYILGMRDNNYRTFKTMLFITCIWILIPLSIYLLSYYPWFGRGYSIGEFLEMVINAYFSLQSLTTHTYEFGMIFLSHTSALEWFTIPIVVGQGTYLNGGIGEFILYMNNFPIWICTIPALIFTTVIAFRRKKMALALPALFFFASYSLFVIVKRPAFLYSAIPLLPFAFTAIAYAVSQASARYSIRFYYVCLAVVITWNMYLYPLVTAKKVPMAPYRYFINKDIKLL